MKGLILIRLHTPHTIFTEILNEISNSHFVIFFWNFQGKEMPIVYNKAKQHKPTWPILLVLHCWPWHWSEFSELRRADPQGVDNSCVAYHHDDRGDSKHQDEFVKPEQFAHFLRDAVVVTKVQGHTRDVVMETLISQVLKVELWYLLRVIYDVWFRLTLILTL